MTSHDHPRLLAPSNRSRHDDLGYVDHPTAAMRDEPEALTKAQHATHVADHAGMRERLRREQRLALMQLVREGLSVEQRLVEVQRQAKLRHINVRGEIQMLVGMLDAARRGGRKKTSASVTTKLERLEHRLDGNHGD